MFQSMLPPIALSALAVLITSPANAQFFPGSSFDPCAPARQVTAAVPQQCVTTCQPAPMVPVAQTCYQTVPVTEYQEVKRKVERPVVETRYVDQEVTAYRPVTETRVQEVPTVDYQNVTEYQTVTRDMGRWVAQREYFNRPTPCQYDGRPGLAGALNRFGYSVRSTFTPNYRTRRQYIPNYVAQTVPVTRQVAVRGTRKVTYNVTRMEPYKTTRKVAVNSVRMVADEVTEMRPVTVMKTVPTGTRVSYVSPSSLGTATASRTPTPAGSQNASVAGGRETTVRSRTADARNGERFERTRSGSNQPYENDKGNAEPFRRDGETFKKDGQGSFPENSQFRKDSVHRNTTQVRPASRHSELWEKPRVQNSTSAAETAKSRRTAMPSRAKSKPAGRRPSRSVPSIVRVNRRFQRPADPKPQRPELRTPGVQVAAD